MSDDSSESSISRRPLLAALGVLGVGALVGAPVVVALIGRPNDPDAAGVDVTLGSLNLFPPGSVRRVVVTADRRDGWHLRRSEPVGTVWVTRGAKDEIHVLSTVCPHLGCSTVQADKAGFQCPCHNSQFTASGEIDASQGTSPSPRGMDPLEHTVVDGVLRCRFQRFRPGTPERIVEAG